MAVALLGSWGTALSHTKESGVNRLLAFSIHQEHSSGTTVVEASAVTYGDQPMTFNLRSVAIDTTDPAQSFQAGVETWYLSEASVVAAAGSDFAVTYAADPGAPDLVVYSHAFWSDVNQSSPVGSSATSFSMAQTPNPITTDAITSTSGDMVVAAVVSGNDGPYTPNNSFTEGTDENTNSHAGATAYKASTGAAETPSETYTDNNPNRQAILGFVIQATSGGGATTVAELGDALSFSEAVDYFQTYTLTIGDSSEGDLRDNLDRGINFGEPPGNITAQRIAQTELPEEGLSLSDNLARALTRSPNLSDVFTFSEILLAPVIDVDLLSDVFTFADSVGINITEGDGWVRVGTPVGAWSAVAAPLPASEFQTLGTFVDVSGGIDFIPVLASGAKGGPYFTIGTDRPIRLRSESNITSTAGLQP